MAKSKTSQKRDEILELLKKHRGAVVGLREIALHLQMPAEQVLTLLGQLSNEVECVSKATMHEDASMKWSDVDSKWKLKGPPPERKPIAWPPRPNAPDPTAGAKATAAELTLRLQQGRLTKDRLEAAAWAGHPAAREALGAAAPTPPDDLAAFGAGFLGYAKPSAAVALLAAGRLALEPHASIAKMDARPKKVLDAVEAWLVSPSKQTATTCSGAAIMAEKAAEQLKTRSPGFAAAARTAYAAGIVAWSIETGADPARVEGLVKSGLTDAATAAGDKASALRDTIREAVALWALAETG